MKYVSLGIFLFSSLTNAQDFSKYEIDTTEIHKEYKVKLVSGKKDDDRFYKGSLSRIYNTSANYLQNAILSFEKKCNNEYAHQRKITDKKSKCLYHNNNLIESKIIKKISTNYKKQQYETERFLVARRIYNRQNFEHVDLVKVLKYTDKKNQKITFIHSMMISDEETKKYIKPPVENNSVFSNAYSIFKITQLDNNKSKLEYFYASETDHWLLNKSISVGRVFESMAKNIQHYLTTLQDQISQTYGVNKQASASKSLKTKI